MEVLPPLSADIFMSYTSLITQADLECTLGRGDVPGDISCTLVLPASASSVLWLEGFGTQLLQWQTETFAIIEFIIELMHNTLPYSCHSGGFGPFSKITLWSVGPSGT